MTEIDAIGLLCPLPVLKLQKALRGLKPGHQIRLLATDPASRIDVPHYCTQSGHILKEATQQDETLVYLVECGPVRTAD
ncbi:MAG: sulfurtransferase TusA family protein [Candidatus Phaeomarinobacter sp.]